MSTETETKKPEQEEKDLSEKEKPEVVAEDNGHFEFSVNKVVNGFYKLVGKCCHDWAKWKKTRDGQITSGTQVKGYYTEQTRFCNNCGKSQTRIEKSEIV